jgi:hypothetical protein
LSNQGYGQERPDYGAAPGQGAGYPGQATGGSPPAQSTAKGFISSLFDFGFNSFVTPKVIKVVYVLITIVLGLVALAGVAFSFRISPIFGIIDLLILAPLGFFIYLALWRIALEIFMIIFRISDDLRIIRDRGIMR